MIVVLERYSIIGLTFSVILILLDFYLVKKRRISGGTYALWLIIGLSVGAVSIVPAFFTLLLIIFETQFLISAVIGTAFLTLLLLVFYLHYRLNEVSDRVIKLVAEISALKYNFNPKRERENEDDC